MTRIEWVASLEDDVRKRFISNVVDGNFTPDFIDYWMTGSGQDKDRVTGIRGAFVWSTSREGHAYWSRINANITNEI